jgi:hypothetical protein
MDETNNVLTIRIQIQPLRNLVTALKDILTDATISFTREGIKIINFDKTHTIIVNVVLSASKFELFNCVPEKIIICANTLHLFKVISTMSNDDTLSCISKADYHDGIVAPGSSIRQRRHQAVLQPKLRLIEPDPESWLSPTWNTRRS